MTSAAVFPTKLSGMPGHLDRERVPSNFLKLPTNG